MRDQGEILITEREKGEAHNWEGGEGHITGRKERVV